MSCESRCAGPSPAAQAILARLPYTTRDATLLRHEIGVEAGLRYVYEGNVPGEGGENTYCYGCKALLIHRYGFFIRRNHVRNSRCPDCGTSIDGVEMDGIQQGGPQVAQC